MSPVTRLAPLVLLALLTDCASLPPIDAGVCGNGVIDPGEDCDTFPTAPGTTCRPPTAPVGACRLDCSMGGVKECPTGWGCGVDAICREATGNFTRQSAIVAADAWRVMTGDFDGDGYSDVVSRAAIDTGGYSNLRVEYYQADPKASAAEIITPSDTLALAPLVASPVVRDVDGDGLSDLAFIASGGLDVMLGQTDRTLDPVAYPAFTDPDTSLVIGSLNVYGVAPTQSLLLFAAVTGSPPGVQIGLPNQASAGVVSTGAKGPSDLPNGLVTARFIDDPTVEACDQLVLAFSGDAMASVYSPCVFKSGTPVANAAPAIAQVKLPGAHLVVAGAAAGDVDGDGHVDLLIGSFDVAGGNSTYVAFGDGKGNFHDATGTASAASFYPVDYGGSTMGIRLPLAAADLNGDGKADFVCPDGIYVSAPPPSATPYVRAFQKSTGLWTDARIADMNADGLLDAIASANDELDADFFLGTGTTVVNPFTIATAGQVVALAVADFDGDRINDVVLAQSVTSTASQQVTIAWGQPFEPPMAPVTVGQFDVVSQTVPQPQAGTTAADLIVLAHPATAATTAVVSILVGSGDRQPLAPYLLTQLGVSNAAIPIAITAGPLTGSQNVDVALLAESANGFTYWLAAGTGSAQFAPPVVSAPLPQGFSPYFATTAGSAHDDALMGSGAIGPGGTQWVVSMAPALATDETKAAIVPATATQAPSITAGAVQPFGVRVSPEGQLDFADVDGDGNVDVVLLSGASVSLSRSVYVAWGNGTGSYSETGSLVVSTPTELPQGFAFVHVDTSGLPALAYVTRTTAVVATIDPKARAVSARSTVDMPTSATGIASGDIDGDGVDDLVEADDGNLVVLHGLPVLP
jgi:hypothetical protein